MQKGQRETKLRDILQNLGWSNDNVLQIVSPGQQLSLKGTVIEKILARNP